jgi:hypothetical protein
LRIIFIIFFALPFLSTVPKLQFIIVHPFSLTLPTCVIDYPHQTLITYTRSSSSILAHSPQ